MGLANLVPGISGGTMLLATGIYPQCIEAIAKLTTLRPDRGAIALIGSVAISAALVVLVLAGTVKDLVLDHRWVMYSIFLGSTLGGIPVLWRLIGKMDGTCAAGTVAGLAAMVATTIVPDGPAAEGTSSVPVLVLAGFGAFAAMLLPGLSGGYLLLLSGQYVPILGAVDGLKAAVLESEGSRWTTLLDSGQVLAPFAGGALVALVGVSSLIQFLLRRQRSLILGLLLGLLAGAVLGLWPFATKASGLVFPALRQGVAALGLSAAGFLVTSAIARLGDAEGST